MSLLYIMFHFSSCVMGLLHFLSAGVATSVRSSAKTQSLVDPSSQVAILYLQNEQMGRLLLMEKKHCVRTGDLVLVKAFAIKAAVGKNANLIAVGDSVLSADYSSWADGASRIFDLRNLMVLRAQARRPASWTDRTLVS